MTRSSRALVAVIVAIGLGVPTLAGAQGRTAPAGSSSSGTATSRGGSSSSGGSSGGSAAPASSGGSGGGGTAAPRTGSSSGTPSGRDRNGRPVLGSAANRPLYNTVTGLPIPVFGPWGRYFPWYNVGFGYDYGFVQFNPYFYGGSFYGWGPWNDPFFYDPFNPFGYGYNVFRYGYGGYDYGSMGGNYGSGGATHVTGSIRLKVSPDEAKVYVDGVLAGTASQFDGLIGDHLVLEGGTHQLELRADGYETYHGTLSVEAGKTLTERVSMKKSK